MGRSTDGAITTADAFAVLDEELIESLWVEDTVGEDALDQIVEDWCRTQDSPAEIVERLRLIDAEPAPVEPAPVVQLPIRASQFRRPTASLRGAA